MIAERIGLGYEEGQAKRARTPEEKAKLDRAYLKELHERGFSEEDSAPVLVDHTQQPDGESIRKRRNADAHMQNEAKKFKLDVPARHTTGTGRRLSTRIQLSTVTNVV